MLVVTRDRIADLFRSHAMVPGPSVRARTWALKQGWVGPLAWDDLDDPAEQVATVTGLPVVDEVAVERAMVGGPVELTSAERAEAVRRLSARGLSDAQVAERLRITSRSVMRIRHREAS